MELKEAREHQRAEATGPFAASDQKSDIAGEAADIYRKCKQEKEMIHALAHAPI
jgi:hypothetical protein